MLSRAKRGEGFPCYLYEAAVRPDDARHYFDQYPDSCMKLLKAACKIASQTYLQFQMQMTFFWFSQLSKKDGCHGSSSTADCVCCTSVEEERGGGGGGGVEGGGGGGGARLAGDNVKEYAIRVLFETLPGLRIAGVRHWHVCS